MAGLIAVPSVDIAFVPAKAGETFKLGPITCRVMEDGSHTDNRIGVAELTLPPKTPGPPPHWHEMHDETFCTSALDHFSTHISNHWKTVNAHAGDYMVVPIRAPHTFSNPGDEPAKILFTSTPSFYINYFKLLSQLAKPDTPVPAEVNVQAMAMFATILADKMPRRPE
ncbi:unnamed protein product [Zymoseptoria tritici ST99CH_3D7]|uniref:Cupin type-2 domain-containing protein n=1 Tax=Zymoseptoria tritici (strain ST99CH_3D7) TaxID=1276538 RepID=A0A1X7RM07_ZYMT9|nr:unnamed protein product [Zymoseptoria tritici ST99CH_3D7]